MTGKELILDFINYILYIVIIIIIVFYFILGDRIGMLYDFVIMLIPLAFFIVIFSLKIKKFQKILKEINNNECTNNEIWYYSKLDKIKNRIIIIVIALVILGVAFLFSGSIKETDLWQATFSFAYLYFFHWFIFKGDTKISSIRLNYKDKLKSELVVYFLPVLIILLPALEDNLSYIDFLQAILVFSIVLIWHLRFFKTKNK